MFSLTPAGLLASLQGTLSNPSLQSSLSNPNIQSSLSSQSFPNSLSSTSLQSSLSNPSIQSSLSSSPSMQSSLSNQSLHSSLSNSSLSGQSLQSAANTVAGSGPCLGSFPPHLPGQVQPPLATSPRKRTQLSPLNLPMGPESRRHHSKQFSPISSPTLSAITQGVPLDTSKLMMDQRLPPYPYSQSQHVQSADAQKGGPSPQSGPATAQQQHHHHHQHAAHLSKEITTALSGVPGFEVDPFSSDDPLRMDPLALDGFGMLADGELMLADPAVEDSFRSDRLK
uniref:Transducer of regulated CREB activity C-terminal domain-containing protein n=1 Tax=Electrophorus electricus TaxID=8005 RepID=A0A4W4G2X7_ELEEL